MDDPLDRFREEVSLGEDLDLGRAALLLGRMLRPELDVEPYLARLDRLGEATARLGPSAAPAIARLFGEGGLRGDEANYYEPRNSFLDQVLDRRLGIPVSLSVIAIEVGRRAGIEVEGVPFPGHFLVRVIDPGGPVLLDPFAGGVAVSDPDLLRRLQAVTGRIGALGPRELGRAGKIQILIRMLGNLRAIYLEHDDPHAALQVQQHLVALGPDHPILRRDRGLLLARLGFAAEARRDLGFYLEREPGAEDAPTVRELVDRLSRTPGPVH